MGGERADRPDIITQPERGRAVALSKVRTTFTPGEVIEVDERELLDLERQGLIYSGELADGESAAEGDELEAEAEPTDKKAGKK